MPNRIHRVEEVLYSSMSAKVSFETLGFCNLSWSVFGATADAVSGVQGLEMLASLSQRTSFRSGTTALGAVHSKWEDICPRVSSTYPSSLFIIWAPQNIAASLYWKCTEDLHL